MADLNDLIEDSNAKLSRRNVVVGTAWAVPAIMAVGAAPAFAASGDAVAITGVALSAAATGAPTRYINISNATATVTVSGTATPGVQVIVTSGSFTSAAVTATGGNWSVLIPATSVPQGVSAYTATVVAGSKPSITSPLTVTKDTTAPVLTRTSANVQPGQSSGTIGGAYGQLLSPTADGSVSATYSSVNLTGVLTQSGGVWSLVWSWGAVGNANKQTITISQSDGAGNTTSLTYKI